MSPQITTFISGGWTFITHLCFFPLGRVPNLKIIQQSLQQMYRICAWKCINLSAISSTSLKLESISSVLWKNWWVFTSSHRYIQCLRSCYWGQVQLVFRSHEKRIVIITFNDSLWNETGNVNKLCESTEYLNSYPSILWRELVCKTSIRRIIREKCYRYHSDPFIHRTFSSFLGMWVLKMVHLKCFQVWRFFG